MPAMQENMLLELAAVIHDPVTTTDELIPSGETSSYRSNPLKLSEFALSRRVPEYVGRAKRIKAEDFDRRSGVLSENLSKALAVAGTPVESTSFGSCVFACKPGDGSAREQAASCQKVLGGDANICYEYATKRYRSNCINWGIVPFTIDKDTPFDYLPGDYVFVPGIREAILGGATEIEARVITADGRSVPILLHVDNLTQEEREILSDGCLMNYYKNRK
ncbi:MAG: hydratase, partial [Bacteroidales bacterium]|nr:hydratase [Bacteroidales bacterium]